MRNDYAYPLSMHSPFEMAKSERVVSAPDLRTECGRRTEYYNLIKWICRISRSAVIDLIERSKAK